MNVRGNCFYCHPLYLPLYYNILLSLFYAITRLSCYRCHLAGGGHARPVAVRQLLPTPDHGYDLAAEHTNSRLEPAGARRVPGLRVHHIVDRVVPVHQHGRAEVQARLSATPSPRVAYPYPHNNPLPHPLPSAP